jgi:ATP sulfurylase
MTRADYESVCAGMRLADGTLWPVPITLDIPEELARGLGPGTMLALRDPEGVMLAALHVEEVWRPNLLAEADAVYGTTNSEHPGVAYLLNSTHPYFVGGGWRESSFPHTMISGRSASRRTNCGRHFCAWVGGGWWRFRPAIPCIGRIGS